MIRKPDSLHWDKSKVFSYNRLFTFVIGARGVGKTWRMKYDRIKKFIDNGEKTYWVMRYRTELDSATEGAKFFGDVQDYFPECDFKILGNLAIIKTPDADEYVPFITFKSLSESSIKAISDPACTMIVFDEFIPIPGIRYLNNEVERFLELYSTISRDRDIRAVFLANNVTCVSPYFSYFKCRLPEQGKIWASGEIAIENVENKEYESHMYKTRFGSLVLGTHYGDYSISNASFADLDTFVAKRPDNAKCVVQINTDTETMYLWIAKPQSLFVSSKGNDCAIKWSVSDSSHGENDERVDFAGTYARRIIQANYRRGTLFFDSPTVKANFMLSCYKLLGNK